MPNFDIEVVMDSLATVSEIIFLRLKCMECNQCEPCGPIFMEALSSLRAAGTPKAIEGGARAAGS